MSNYTQDNEKFKTAQSWYKIAKEQNNQLAIEILEQNYTELKESEDERIRKALFGYFKERKDDGDVDETWYGISYDKILAWLEKQGEQKPTWSEKDEKLLNLSLENLTELKNRFGETYGKVGDCIHWLKSIKERMKGE